MQRERFYDDPTLTRTAARVLRHDEAALTLRLIETEGTDLQPCGGTHGARNRRVAYAYAED
jgi:Ser-tRNA(Ala) deacylase AlaX